mmetsp:Transcript_31151/g.81739  ORF Transcript_31151/g.81739 Transcript_31151/m.81739 type:complete len:335 (-) Transcript_31151:132-1136(-)
MNGKVEGGEEGREGKVGKRGERRRGTPKGVNTSESEEEERMATFVRYAVEMSKAKREGGERQSESYVIMSASTARAHLASYLLSLISRMQQVWGRAIASNLSSSTTPNLAGQVEGRNDEERQKKSTLNRGGTVVPLLAPLSPLPLPPTFERGGSDTARSHSRRKVVRRRIKVGEEAREGRGDERGGGEKSKEKEGEQERVVKWDEADKGGPVQNQGESVSKEEVRRKRRPKKIERRKLASPRSVSSSSSHPSPSSLPPLRLERRQTREELLSGLVLSPSSPSSPPYLSSPVRRQGVAHTATPPFTANPPTSAGTGAVVDTVKESWEEVGKKKEE